MYEIAKNKDIQTRLRKEIKDMLTRSEGKITYDFIMSPSEMPYLSQIVQETLRKYPILPFLDRECVNKDGYSLEPYGDFMIPFGMPVYVPIYAMHRNPDYFPDPDKFDPERFSPENIGNIQPFTYFPFGSGPRNCIGERFGLMQVKTGIVKLLKDFSLETSAKTPEKITLEKKTIIFQSENGLILNLVKESL